MSTRPHRSLRSRLVPKVAALTRWAPPTPVLLAGRPALRRGLQCLPRWRARVERNMLAGLGPEGCARAHVHAYFDHLADLFTFSLAVFRSGVHAAGLERQWIHEPGVERCFRTALDAGKGAIMVCPHLIGHEIMAGTATDRLPITVLARQSPDEGYEAVKRKWYEALGVEVAYRPSARGEAQSLAALTAAFRPLKQNRVLALTPDLIQKPGKGVPVRFLNRSVELPAGPFFLAVRTGAPLIPCFFHKEEARYRLWAREPLPVDPVLSRAEAVAELAQAWAALFEGFLRDHPDMWQFWLDKRWSAWLQS